MLFLSQVWEHVRVMMLLFSNAGQPQWDVNGKGYISLNINLPQEKSNRANDVFNDGEASEYAIHNASYCCIRVQVPQLLPTKPLIR